MGQAKRRNPDRELRIEEGKKKELDRQTVLATQRAERKTRTRSNKSSLLKMMQMLTISQALISQSPMAQDMIDGKFQ